MRLLYHTWLCWSGHAVSPSILREGGGQPTTSIVDLCVHRPKSDLLRSVVKGGGGGVETDVCGGENSCTMYSTKRGERGEKKRVDGSSHGETCKRPRRSRGEEQLENERATNKTERRCACERVHLSWRGKSFHEHERGKCGSEENMTAAIRRGRQ